jgi:hypothetical protein
LLAGSQPKCHILHLVRSERFERFLGNLPCPLLAGAVDIKISNNRKIKGFRRRVWPCRRYRIMLIVGHPLMAQRSE